MLTKAGQGEAVRAEVRAHVKHARHRPTLQQFEAWTVGRRQPDETCGNDDLAAEVREHVGDDPTIDETVTLQTRRPDQGATSAALG